MRTFRKVVGYSLLLAPFLFLSWFAKDAYIGVLIATYGITAALLTLD